MKIISALLALSLTTASFAGVKEEVTKLGQIAFGHDVHQSKGKSAEAVFKHWIEVQNGETEGLVYKEARDMESADEVDEGFTSVKSAIEMGGFAEAQIEEYLENLEGAELRKAKAHLAQIAKNWGPQIKKLSQMGVKFGYTGWGPGYCGISFVELIVVDPKEAKVYEVYLSKGGDC